MKVDLIIDEVECMLRAVCILIVIYLCLINIAAFIICGIDKWRAIHGRWRISEKCLMLLAVFGGSIGMLGGMYFFRHKTKHPKFYVGVPVILVLQMIIALLVILKTHHIL